MSARRRLRRSGTSKIRRGIIRERIARAVERGRPTSKGWRRMSGEYPDSSLLVQRAEAKRARRRQRRLDVDRWGYVR